MNDFFGPFLAANKQLMEAHKANTDAMFKSMSTAGFEGLAKAGYEAADAQFKAWEKWLALWGPRR